MMMDDEKCRSSGDQLPVAPPAMLNSNGKLDGATGLDHGGRCEGGAKVMRTHFGKIGGGGGGGGGGEETDEGARQIHVANRLFSILQFCGGTGE
mmetsp:Transcript_31554/g.92518  ORF Transcript_31554/g.92518 Transcript_31554/m.92518 type:complete len:94 (+) Transcript_31554:1416-1697(+)